MLQEAEEVGRGPGDAFVMAMQGSEEGVDFEVGTLEDTRGFGAVQAIGKTFEAFEFRTPRRYCDQRRRRRLSSPLEDVDFDSLDFGITQATWKDSSVVTDWNPDTLANTWPRSTDDGSARYLSQFADLTMKDKLYVNFNFLIRQTQELLEEEGLHAEMETLFWVHGEKSPDQFSWDVLAGAYSRLFTQLREDLGLPNLPIIDFGAGSSDVLNTAKASAAEQIGGMDVVAFALPGSRSDDDCDPATDLCGTVPWELQNLYGADACDPEAPTEAEGAPTFQWFAECGAGAPLGFDAETLCGEIMTEAYIRSLDGGEAALVAAGLPPAPGQIERCADGEALAARSADAWCWEDLREPPASRG